MGQGGGGSGSSGDVSVHKVPRLARVAWRATTHNPQGHRSLPVHVPLAQTNQAANKHTHTHLLQVSVGHLALPPIRVHLRQHARLDARVSGDVVDAVAQHVGRRLIASQDERVGLRRNLWCGVCVCVKRGGGRGAHGQQQQQQHVTTPEARLATQPHAATQPPDSHALLTTSSPRKLPPPFWRAASMRPMNEPGWTPLPEAPRSARIASAWAEGEGALLALLLASLLAASGCTMAEMVSSAGCCCCCCCWILGGAAACAAAAVGSG
jgi:hypothetical protein